jgi:nucleoside 2-deoxyribosyltransferase
MSKAYLALSFAGKERLQPVVDTIRKVLADAGVELFVFVEQYLFSPGEAKAMMQQAFTCIRDCDLLIAEVSEKAIGVGIEIGYAAALLKPIIYIRHENAGHSTTCSGSADHTITYGNTAELEDKLGKLVCSL